MSEGPSRGGRAARVTGIGLVTPAGADAPTSWKTVLSGATAAAPLPAGFEGTDVRVGCPVPEGADPALRLGPRARRLDRFTQFALAAALEAVADSGLDPAALDGDRVAVVLGTALAGVRTWEEQHGRFTADGPAYVSPLTVPRAIPNMAAAVLSMEFGAHGPSLAVSTACAAGTTAVGLALDLLRSGRYDVVIAGGAEAALTPPTVAAFDRLGALSRSAEPAGASRPFDRDRSGFVLGEGAGVLVLEIAAHAEARGARSYATVLGHGATCDAHHPTAPDPAGRAAERALRLALDDAGVAPADIAHVNAHATGTPQGDAVEAATLHRVFGPGGPAVSSTKGVTGHLLGAAGAVEAAFTALAIAEGVVPPTANLTALDATTDLGLDLPTTARPGPVPLALTQSFGFGGHNAALVLGAV
ncbi:beta-ketoacyl-[acyl-carrier-protein] synthase family protein [Streptomyces sp. NPDC001941]|uniref:beta-ketoacyl-[acyl-carrier-protein] synthase family protein n=1 Tax=Streptomyces sp. NPDC001941 TaxID=3154659 RepID=UPI0033345C25